MPWTPTHIGWDQQIMLMWILLPPIFLACGFLAFAAPLFFRERKIKAPRPKTAPAERVLANAN
jgi:hypothetical protein